MFEKGFMRIVSSDSSGAVRMLRCSGSQAGSRRAVCPSHYAENHFPRAHRSLRLVSHL
ncbi:hypothetical protein TSAR_000467 [Trichomalopsis sarcophagae]|uniref:Uncharacterized protein n=1 Tax=Trichomalopsis sarcophagae TaxID=543379 RepID=A0A232F9W2_9HYME|nr:hypothetical protein TSAR_000467 [Trichomalopsis sarcophagae]